MPLDKTTELFCFENIVTPTQLWFIVNYWNISSFCLFQTIFSTKGFEVYFNHTEGSHHVSNAKLANV